MKIQNSGKMTFLAVVFLLSCNVPLQDDKNSNRESALDTINEFESEYRKKVVREVGITIYYVDSKDIHNYFDESRILDAEYGKEGDTVLFFDNDGNIRYQALLLLDKAGKIRVKCTRISTGEDYLTSLDTDSIIDLDNQTDYTIKIYSR